MTLQQQIDRFRSEIRTDEYSMSLGEWINLYEHNELDIHPEFQRFFRWTLTQKTRFIESILLGIPIPSIFVAQREDGVWDIVDGLQRLSTIFEFLGILRNENNVLRPPLQLEATKYLPDLAHTYWDNADDTEHSLDQQQRLYIKRARTHVSIITRESDVKTKFELFQRLNTGGSFASDQEVRNCMLVGTNPELYTWMQDLSTDSNFLTCIALSDRAFDERYDLELVLRFLVFRLLDQTKLRSIHDIEDFLDDELMVIATSDTFDHRMEETAFRHTFEILALAAGDNSFRRYNESRERFMGGFLLSAFEAVALGVGFNEQNLRKPPQDILQSIEHLWSNSDFIGSSGSGVRASTRIPKVIPLGRLIFRP